MEIIVSIKPPKKFKQISDQTLMEIINGMTINLKMVKEFNLAIVKIVLRKRLEQTGLPFLSIYAYLKSILKFSSHRLMSDVDDDDEDDDDEDRFKDVNYLRCVNNCQGSNFIFPNDKVMIIE